MVVIKMKDDCGISPKLIYCDVCPFWTVRNDLDDIPCGDHVTAGDECPIISIEEEKSE